ncbi:class I SAM-dependent methyltransferase [Alteribacter natronophilus]|uniref:class I SAM-dependent methyltransferase n=1 Tax=Alteribacter natronophilus TaxID=2583810 RepID=UPI00110EC842|nr:methyltransferase domain-containing protein [Alteribacter natronophilus]TMW71043.1 methyltransferase domain-containing protein [Alteribacter natronophilus]
MGALYDRIGKTYDTTRKADPEITRRLRSQLHVKDGAKVLDVACGTGNYTVALEKSGLDITGCDISDEMLEKARDKSHSITWDEANAGNLPYEDGQFEGAVCTLAIHHMQTLLPAFKEVFRVMRSGRFVIFTSAPEQMDRYWLKEYFPKAVDESASQMPMPKEVNRTLMQAGFRIVGHESFLVQPDLQDFFLYSGKFDPSMYLDPDVRAGISTFSSLASEEEVTEGCRRLQADIESGQIEEVRSRYRSSRGDYLFIVAEKV